MRILYLDLDTLRPDHLGCYGYERNTSPNLDKIAAEGVTFTNYYCSDAPCLPSRSALMSGMFGIRSGVVSHGGTAADYRLTGQGREFQDWPNYSSLAGMLRRRCGLKTALISPFADRHSTYQFYAGFSETYDTGKCGMESAEDVTPTVLDWIERNAEDDDWYLQVNFWDAHTQYRAPEEFGNPFADEPGPSWITQEVLDEHKKHIGPHGANELNMYDDQKLTDRQPARLDTLEEVKEMHDGYDCGIRYMDEHIGRVMDALEKKGVLDDLVIIISADHAENMGELGIYGEHATADYANCRIPMIIRWPGKGQKGVKDTGLRHNLDLIPTLAEMFEIDTSDFKQGLDGVSFAKAITEGDDAGKEYAVISQCAHTCQRGVRFGPWMYIRTYHDGFHLFDKHMLFNIEDDPHEQNNLAEKMPEIVRQGESHLFEWHDEMMMTSRSQIDPMWTVMKEGGPYHARKNHLVPYLERLEKTGRAEGAEKLRERHKTIL